MEVRNHQTLAASWKTEDTILANVLAEVEGACVRVSVTLVPWLLQHYKTYVFMLFQEIGDLLAHQQTADLDLACSPAALLPLGAHSACGSTFECQTSWVLPVYSPSSQLAN